jgi:hypothetical protein
MGIEAISFLKWRFQVKGKKKTKIIELELNPILAYSKGAIAVNARIILEENEK